MGGGNPIKRVWNAANDLAQKPAREVASHRCRWFSGITKQSS